MKDSALSIVTQTFIEDQSEQRPEDVKQFIEAFIESIDTQKIADYISKPKTPEGDSFNP